MSKTDEREYGTGDNPNPLDQPSLIPRKDEWQGNILAARATQLEGQPWYPRADASPETQIPKRYQAFRVDAGDFQAAVSPQRWDCTTTIQVPVNDGAHGNPIEVVPFLPGRASLTVINTGTVNSIIVSPNLEAALAGRGMIVSAGNSFSMDCQGAIYAWGQGGASTVQAMWTFFEAPQSHLPPKETHGD